MKDDAIGMVIFHTAGYGNPNATFFTKVKSNEEASRYGYERGNELYFLCYRGYRKRAIWGKITSKTHKKRGCRSAESLDSSGFGGIFYINCNQNLTNRNCSVIMPKV